MSSQDLLVFRAWIDRVRNASHLEKILACYLLSETVKKKNIRSRKLLKDVTAASIVLATKFLRDENHITMAEISCICPPFPPFLDAYFIARAEKIILEAFDYNIARATHACFNTESMRVVHKEISSKVATVG